MSFLPWLMHIGEWMHTKAGIYLLYTEINIFCFNPCLLLLMHNGELMNSDV